MDTVKLSLLNTNKPNSDNKRKKTRHKFTKEEDQKLLSLVNQYGKNCWSFVAQNMDGLTARQCRERYQDYLTPGIRNEVWTNEEELLLQQKVAEYGQRWTTIAKFFNSRTDVNIKNHWTILSQRIAKSKKMENEKERLLSRLDPNIAKQYCPDFSFSKPNCYYQKPLPGTVIPQYISPVANLVPTIPISSSPQQFSQQAPSRCSLPIANTPPSPTSIPVSINSFVATVHPGSSLSVSQPTQPSQPISPLPPLTSNFSQSIQCPVMMIKNNTNHNDNLSPTVNNNNNNYLITISNPNEKIGHLISTVDFSQPQLMDLPPLLQQPKEKQLASPISFLNNINMGGMGQVDYGFHSPSTDYILNNNGNNNNICTNAGHNNTNSNQDVDKDIFEPVPGSIDAIEIETRPYDIKSVE